MPGLYSMWLGFEKLREIELKALQIKRRRRRRAGRFTGSTLKKQLEKAYQTPLKELLEELDDNLIRLEETYLAPAREFSAPPYGKHESRENVKDNSKVAVSRKIFAVKLDLKDVIESLKKMLSYRNRKMFFITMPQLQSVLADLSLYAGYLYKQIEMYQNSKNYNQGILFRFTNNGINNLLKKYHQNIERIEPEADETVGSFLVKQPGKS